MNNSPAQIRKQIKAARTVAESTRLALCHAASECAKATPAWPQAEIDKLNNQYEVALAARKNALDKLNSLLSCFAA